MKQVEPGIITVKMADTRLLSVSWCLTDSAKTTLSTVT